MPDLTAFLAANTRVSEAPLVPGIKLHLADALTPIWQATEISLAAADVAPPYWAFAWPGAQALARHMLAFPGLVRGKTVLDFAAGCGLAAIAAIAAVQAGAASAAASEIDPLAIAAIEANAALNGVTIETRLADLTQGPPPAEDLILCGDICYERAMAERIMPWLRAAAAAGGEVWVADPGRAYLPAGLDAIAVYEVPTTLELEDRLSRTVTIFRVRA